MILRRWTQVSQGKSITQGRKIWYTLKIASRKSLTPKGSMSHMLKLRLARKTTFKGSVFNALWMMMHQHTNRLLLLSISRISPSISIPLMLSKVDFLAPKANSYGGNRIHITVVDLRVNINRINTIYTIVNFTTIKWETECNRICIEGSILRMIRLSVHRIALIRTRRASLH